MFEEILQKEDELVNWVNKIPYSLFPITEQHSVWHHQVDKNWLVGIKKYLIYIRMRVLGGNYDSTIIEECKMSMAQYELQKKFRIKKWNISN